ncbi:NUDIX domain-containing protein [Halomicroarcula sp. F13]|uniref:NUDIX domain-containing protein n=1 Tax=Haloarcula rubra TaxID=2487747 RepID=A0AAW4PTA2_9EURY|nr:NUDIX domain-containing protein [Halomicroarcula rubra]MBX0323904.1 NUDIX domain-containing protein [Halomicroarcula rubra]
MTLESRTRDAVRAELERLVDTYGDVPVRRDTVTNDPAFFERGEKLAEEGWLGDAGAWVTDDAGRVLLIRHRGAPETWGTPGGGHEPGEGLDDTARREVREETGVDCTLTGLYYARWKTIVHAEDADRRLHMLTVEFDAEATADDLAVDDDEVLDARWFETVPEELHEIPATRSTDESA